MRCVGERELTGLSCGGGRARVRVCVYMFVCACAGERLSVCMSVCVRG